MKNLITFIFIFYTICSSSALADVRYTCREAIRNESTEFYSATLVPGGSILQMQFESAEDSRGHISIMFEGELADFPIRVLNPPRGTQGELGRIIRPLKKFYFDFAMLPNYKEVNTQGEFLGGDLSFKGVEKFMLCDSALFEVFH